MRSPLSIVFAFSSFTLVLASNKASASALFGISIGFVFASAANFAFMSASNLAFASASVLVSFASAASFVSCLFNS
jgi:hypothetical protein